MTESTENHARSLISSLSDRHLAADAREAREINPVEQLKMSVFDFFTRAIERVDRLEKSRENARALVDRLIERSIETADEDDLEVAIARAERLFRLTSSEANRASESIIGLFKPVPGAPSILANSVGNSASSEDDSEAFYSRLTPEQRAIFEKLREMTAAK